MPGLTREGDGIAAADDRSGLAANKTRRPDMSFREFRPYLHLIADAEALMRLRCEAMALDNVFIERLWRSLKYECIYLNAFETGSETRAGIGRWIPNTIARGPTRLSAAERLRRPTWPATASTWRRDTHTRTKLSEAANPSTEWGPPHQINAQNLA